MKATMKRVLCLLLSTIMVCSMLAGCGEKTTPTDAPQSTEAPKATDAPTDGATETPTEVPLEKVKVTIAYKQIEENVNWLETPVIKELEELASDYLEIEWIEWPGTSSGEKLTLAMNGGDYPDVLMGTFLMGTDTTVNYASQGLLLPLEEYFTEEIMPNTAYVFEQRPEWLEGLTSADGHVYTLPMYSEPAADYRTFNDTININSEWLKKVGMEIPTTTEELYEVLKAFKAAGDLNENGLDDEIPLSFAYLGGWGNHQFGTHSMIGWFGLAMNANAITLKDDKAVFVPVQDEFKAAVEYFHKLWSEDLIDVEAFTMDNATYTAKRTATTPILGVAPAYHSYQLNSGAGAGVYQYVAPLTSPTGETPSWQYRDSEITKNLALWVTDKAEGKMVQIMKFIDLFMDQERAVEWAVAGGQPGVHVVEVSDNMFESQIDPSTGKVYTEPVRSAWAPVGDMPLMLLRENYTEVTGTTDASIATAEAVKIYKQYNEAKPSLYLNPWIDPTASEELSLLTAELVAYYQQWFATFITEGGIEENWDSYVKGFEELGYERYLELKVRAEYLD